jgi:hypothetical protein
LPLRGARSRGHGRMITGSPCHPSQAHSIIHTPHFALHAALYTTFYTLSVHIMLTQMPSQVLPFYGHLMRRKEKCERKRQYRERWERNFYLCK